MLTAIRRPDEAEPLQLRSFEIYKDERGLKHPNTLVVMYKLAYTWKRQGRVDEAITLLAETVALREEVLGPSHLSTVVARERLQRWQAEYEESQWEDITDSGNDTDSGDNDPDDQAMDEVPR